jgi:hypothetical protein
MLRWVMGEDSFFAALRDYGQQHAFANAVTTDFQAVCESHYGESLQWFFDEWVYEGTGYPQYVVEYSIEFDWWLLTISQQQSGERRFMMPMEVAFYNGPQLARLDTLWVNDDPLFYYPPENHYYSIVIDPNNWILKQVEYLPTNDAEDAKLLPGDFKLQSLYPNPFNPSATLEFTLSQASPVELTVYDIQGREVSQEYYDALPPGVHTLKWDGSRHASGVYIFSLQAQHARQAAKAVLLK